MGCSRRASLQELLQEQHSDAVGAMLPIAGRLAGSAGPRERTAVPRGADLHNADAIVQLMPINAEETLTVRAG